MGLPKVKVYFDFNSPYSLVTIVRLYQMSKGIQPKRELEFPSADISHPAFKSVNFELKPVEFGLVLKKLGAPIPAIKPGSKRAEYMWLDVPRSLKQLGIENLDPKSLSNWPQRATNANRALYLLQNPDILAQGATEVLAPGEAAKVVSLAAAATPQGTGCITLNFAYRASLAVFIENRLINNEDTLRDLLTQVLQPALPGNSNSVSTLTNAIIEIAAKSAAVKAFSFAPTNTAIELNIFGVPTFTTESSPTPFWGNDHMIDAAIDAHYSSAHTSKL